MEEQSTDDEVINVKLPRKKYELLRQMIEREEAWGWFGRTIKAHWIWVVGGGILTLFLLSDKIHSLIVNVKV